MKVSILEKIYVAILSVILAGIVVHAPLSVWLGVILPDYDLLIKSWKELLIGIATILAIVVITKRRAWATMQHDRICQIIAAYIVVHLVLLLALYQGLVPSLAGLIIDLRYVVFFSLVYVAVLLFPQYRRRLLWIAGIGACVVVSFATLQLFLPADILVSIGYGKDTIMPYLTVDQNPDYIRVNSTLRGPNPLGAYTVVVLGLLAAVFVRQREAVHSKKVIFATVAFAACSLIALWISYSRSALVAAIVAVLIVLGVTVARRLSKSAWIAGVAVLVAIASGLVAARDSAFVSNVILHDNATTGGPVTSDQEHAASLAYGIDRLMHQPFGAGVGSTGSASLYGDSPLIIENQYLFVAHETGWLGLGLFAALFVLILHRLWRGRSDWLSLGVFASGVGLGLIGLLQPVWVDDTVSIIWWGLAAIAFAGRASYERKKTK